jgi:hypothetical protein
MLVEGFGSLLLLLSVASNGPADVPLPAGGALPAPGLLWVAFLDSDENDDEEELAPRSPLASSKGIVSGSVRNTADVCHDEEAPVEPCDGLSTVVGVLGAEDEWI